MTPISAKNTNAIETLAALKRRLRNTLTSSIGWSVCRSQAMNAAMIAAPAAKAGQDHRAAPAALGRLDQGPDDGAEAGDRQTGAGQIDLGRLGVTRVRTSTAAPIRHATTTGRLTRKMLLQAKCSIRKPPEIGPIAMPSPATAAQAAIAFGRSLEGKMLVRIESVVGMIPAAPRPISARDAISVVASLETAASDGPEPEHRPARP